MYLLNNTFTNKLIKYILSLILLPILFSCSVSAKYYPGIVELDIGNTSFDSPRILAYHQGTKISVKYIFNAQDKFLQFGLGVSGINLNSSTYTQEQGQEHVRSLNNFYKNDVEQGDINFIYNILPFRQYIALVKLDLEREGAKRQESSRFKQNQKLLKDQKLLKEWEKVLEHFKDTNFNQLSLSVKTIFLDLLCNLSTNINNDISLYLAFKIGGGYISITNKLKDSNLKSELEFKAKGITWAVTPEIGIRFLILSYLKFGITLSSSRYGIVSVDKHELTFPNITNVNYNDLLDYNKFRKTKNLDLEDFTISFNIAFNL